METLVFASSVTETLTISFPKYLVDGSNTCFPLHCISVCVCVCVCVCVNHQLCYWSEWSVLSKCVWTHRSQLVPECVKRRHQ